MNNHNEVLQHSLAFRGVGMIIWRRRGSRLASHGFEAEVGGRMGYINTWLPEVGH